MPRDIEVGTWDRDGTAKWLADSDGDGLSDQMEQHFGSDPHDIDSDDDGLLDGEEVRTTVSYNRIGASFRATEITSPTAADSDADALTDFAELRSYGTDPTEEDSDRDGLSDGAEITTYGTDPLAADSDGDGIGDGGEVTLFHSDPLSVDTDGDGLADGEEVFNYGTDPTSRDSDGDGWSDRQETIGITADDAFEGPTYSSIPNELIALDLHAASSDQLNEIDSVELFDLDIG